MSASAIFSEDNVSSDEYAENPGYSELSRDGHIPYWDLPMKAIEIPLNPIMDGLFRTDSWMLHTRGCSFFYSALFVIFHHDLQN